MPTLSMNEVTTFRWSLEEDVRRYVAAGYEGIGVWRPQALRLRRGSGRRPDRRGGPAGDEPAVGRRLHRQRRPHAGRKRAGRGACAFGWPGRWARAAWWCIPAGGTTTSISHAERLLRTAIEQLLDYAADVGGGAGDRADAPGVRGGVDVSHRSGIDGRVRRAVTTRRS